VGQGLQGPVGYRALASLLSEGAELTHVLAACCRCLLLAGSCLLVSCAV
jgi:hypothetical protein